MSEYVVLGTEFWKDYNSKGLTCEQKYLLAYLMTNNLSKQCGIMKFDLSEIAKDTGYSEKVVKKILRQLEMLGEVLISQETGELMIVDLVDYIPFEEKKIMDHLIEKLNEVESDFFVQLFYFKCKAKINLKMKVQTRGDYK